MGGYAPKPITERFWPKVTKAGQDDCWIWNAARAYGYGRIGGGGQFGRALMAHRVSWEIHFGPIPSGLHVLHHCDNPPCVNPRHLFLGTDADNHADKSKKGRASREIKLTRANVREILSSDGSPKEISNRLGVPASHIYNIRNGHKWPSIEA